MALRSEQECTGTPRPEILEQPLNGCVSTQDIKPNKKVWDFQFLPKEPYADCGTGAHGQIRNKEPVRYAEERN